MALLFVLSPTQCRGGTSLRQKCLVLSFLGLALIPSVIKTTYLVDPIILHVSLYRFNPEVERVY